MLRGKKKKFVEAYATALGNVSAACRMVGMDRKTFYNWCASDGEFKARVEEVDEAELDFTETMLKKRVREGDITAIIFHLKTKGKKRGYVERIENTGADGAPLVPARELTVGELAELMKQLESE